VSAARDLDVVVFGATGFVGRLTAEYLAANAPERTRIGLAARSRDKLEGVRQALGPRAADWPLLVADAADRGSLDALAGATRAVATTVGPYRRHGLPLVEACAAAGTHYADLTGEVLFIRDSIDRCHATAQASGARIVHACGFDSIPSDLGVLTLHEAAQEADAGELEDTTLLIAGLRGGTSGGTLASMTGQLEDMAGDAEARRIAADPYALSPDRGFEPDLGDESDLRVPVHDDALGTWLAPFVMAMVNTRVVRRSNALQSWAYGRRFRYREAIRAGGGPVGAAKAAAVAGGTGAAFAALSFPPTRAMLDRFLPSPGEGPDEETRRTGFYRIEVHARTSSGRRLVCHVAQRGDPGYAATAVLLGESALCLAADDGGLPDRAGVLTPATAMGHALTERLRAAGVTLDARPSDD
jgi:short subunit dehydrogenase-like uncharacterized protein